MILVADSGSTKTAWYLLDISDNQQFKTSGLNPYFLDKSAILNVLQKELPVSASSVSCVYFYGSGCTPEKQAFVKEILDQHFEVKNSEVYSDLLGASRSLCRDEEGIVCILGTGSNSCYYDGKNIVENVSPLGFILGDEGSGAVLGKILLADILKKQLPASIRDEFFRSYNITAAEIIDKVYRQSLPNRFLAQFTPFISKHIGLPEIKTLVENSFSEFIRRNVLQYSKTNYLPVHFTGSIAWHFRNHLEEVLKKFNLQLGKITKDPLLGLAEYHLNKITDD
jgi:N-acetylglucosamine kinase-like BadF-type ATPase